MTVVRTTGATTDGRGPLGPWLLVLAFGLAAAAGFANLLIVGMLRVWLRREHTRRRTQGGRTQGGIGHATSA